MTEHPETPAPSPEADGEPAATAPEPIAAGSAPQPPPSSPSLEGPYASLTAGAADRPEVMVGAAFAGGFLAALILRRLVR